MSYELIDWEMRSERLCDYSPSADSKTTPAEMKQQQTVGHPALHPPNGSQRKYNSLSFHFICRRTPQSFWDNNVQHRMLSSHWLCSTVATKCMDSETLACGETVVQMEGMVFSNGQSRHFNGDRSKTSSSSSRLLDCMLPAAGLLLDDAAVSHSLYCWFTCTFHRHMFKCSHNLTELFDWTTVIGRHPEDIPKAAHFLKPDV